MDFPPLANGAARYKGRGRQKDGSRCFPNAHRVCESADNAPFLLNVQTERQRQNERERRRQRPLQQWHVLARHRPYLGYSYFRLWFCQIQRSNVTHFYFLNFIFLHFYKASHLFPLFYMYWPVARMNDTVIFLWTVGPPTSSHPVLPVATSGVERHGTFDNTEVPVHWFQLQSSKDAWLCGLTLLSAVNCLTSCQGQNQIQLFIAVCLIRGWEALATDRMIVLFFSFRFLSMWKELLVPGYV